MLELGDDSVAEHDAIGRLAVRLDVKRLVVVGEGARPIDSGARQEGSWGEEAAWVARRRRGPRAARAESSPPVTSCC